MHLHLPEVKDITWEEVQALKNFEPSKVGFQASELARGAEVLKEMKKQRAFTIFAFTANIVATGLRGVIKEMCKQKLVDLIITTPGALEHDAMRALHTYYLGYFNLDDRELHEKGMNRIGNVLVPNEAYVKLESFLQPIFDSMEKLSSISLAKSMGLHLPNSSFLYWCAKNEIPVFCPGLIDGAIGLNLYFYNKKRPLDISIREDMDFLAQKILEQDKTGALIVGGGIAKHFTLGLNLLREGLDYAVYLSTAVEWDGSLSGAKPKEAQSWGKIQQKARHVAIYGEATLALPLLIAHAYD